MNACNRGIVTDFIEIPLFFKLLFFLFYDNLTLTILLSLFLKSYSLTLTAAVVQVVEVFAL